VGFATATGGAGVFSFDQPFSGLTYNWDTTATGTGTFLIPSAGMSCAVINRSTSRSNKQRNQQRQKGRPAIELAALFLHTDFRQNHKRRLSQNVIQSLIRYGDRPQRGSCNKWMKPLNMQDNLFLIHEDATPTIRLPMDLSNALLTNESR
jgi:hypothetical protein